MVEQIRAFLSAQGHQGAAAPQSENSLSLPVTGDSAKDRDILKIAAVVVSALRDRDDLESVSVAEQVLSEEEIERMLPDVRKVKLPDRPPLQMRAPSSYRRALDLLASERNQSLNHLVSDYVREGLARDLAKLRDEKGELPEDWIAEGDPDPEQ